MKFYVFFIFLLSVFLGFSQANTDVFLFDLRVENGKLKLSNIKNISDNEGYDNQPSFLDANTILYAGNRNEQTDIVKYNINYDSKIFVNHTKGSEYSPLKIPGTKAISAIRLDKDGTQFLYRYNLRNGESEVLINDIIIGYHIWFNTETLVSSVLEDGILSLYTTNLKTHKNYKYDTKVGRSLHKIPNSNLISYISKQDDSWKIKSLNPLTGKIKLIVNTLAKVEDMCWLANGTILMAKDDVLYKLKVNSDFNWVKVTSLKNLEINNITRLAVNTNETKLALVGEAGNSTTPTGTDSNSGTNQDSSNTDKISKTTETEKIVQQQFNVYNKKDIYETYYYRYLIRPFNQYYSPNRPKNIRYY